MGKSDIETIGQIVRSLEEQFGKAKVAQALGQQPGRGPRRPQERLDLIAQPEFQAQMKDLLAGFQIPPGTDTAVGGGAELIKWVFKPTLYRDFIGTKNKEQTDRVQVPEDESDVNAPNVTAEIEECKCTEGVKGWIQVTFRITATSGADNDDVTRVRLSLPSTDCNGYRHRDLPHVFGVEQERQTHLRTIDVKCSDVILRREDPPDGFLWVELEVVDDDGNSRTTWMKLSSPALDKCISDCCRRSDGTPGDED